MTSTVYPFYSGNKDVSNLKAIHALLKTFSNTSLKQITKSPDLQHLRSKYQFLVAHCNRKAYQIEFIRCESSNCLHCCKLPVRDNVFLEVIRNFGGTLPTPVDSDVHHDHYKSLDEMLNLSTSNLKVLKRSINNCTDNGVCPYPSCHYAFFSKADKQRHFNLMEHPKS